MKTGRTWLSVLLGLMLLLQGYAVSATPRENLVKATDAEMAMQMDMPCQGHMASTDEGGKPSCCNADCPDMTTCALGHFVSTTTFALDSPRRAVPAPVLLVARGTSAAPAFLLRPPILSHG